MIKLFRCIGVEHRKLWSKNSAIFCVILSAVISVCAVIIVLLALDSGKFDSTLFANSVQGRYMLSELNASERESVETVDDEENLQSEARLSLEESVTSATDEPFVQRDEVRGAERVEQLNDNIKEIDIALEIAQGQKKLSLERERAALLREKSIAAFVNDGKAVQGHSDTWGIIIFCLWLVTPLIVAIAVGMSCDMFAGEFERGTAGLMLCRPATRGKQYTAKLVTSLLYIVTLFATVFFAALLTCVLTVSPRSQGQYVGSINGRAYSASWFVHGLDVMLCCTWGAFVCVLLCAAIGNLTRSRAAAVGAAVSTALISFRAADLISAAGVKLFGVSLFSCMDLSAALLYLPYENAVSFADCAVSLCVHSIIIAVVGYIALKRDVE